MTRIFSLLLTILFSATCIFAQEIDIKNIPSEIKKPVKIYGTSEDDVFFSFPTHVKFDRYFKKVYLIDKSEGRILVFDSELNFIKEIGRKGQGPVEFLVPTDIAVDKNGFLYVCEMGNKRVQILNKDFENVSSFYMEFNIGMEEIDLDSKGRIYLNRTNDGFLFTIYNKDGDKIESFEEISEYENKQKQQMDNKVHFTIDENDEIYCGFSNSPIVRKYNNNFNLVSCHACNDV